MQRFISSWLAGVLAAGVGVLVGCDSGPPMATVHGEVAFDGQAVKNGSVQFSPIDGKTGTAGAVIEDGKFTTRVPVGEMRVEIRAPKATGKKVKMYDTADSPQVDEVIELIPPRYNSQSELKWKVERGTHNKQFDLKSK